MRGAKGALASLALPERSGRPVPDHLGDHLDRGHINGLDRDSDRSRLCRDGRVDDVLRADRCAAWAGRCSGVFRSVRSFDDRRRV